jgi:hypothetical protein
MRSEIPDGAFPKAANRELGAEGSATPGGDTARRQGRPKKWSTAQERQEAAGKRRAQRLRMLGELELALLNAQWDDPALQHVVALGEEFEALEALIRYFRGRHWMRTPPTPRRPDGLNLEEEKT